MSKPLIYCTACGRNAYTVPPKVHRCSKKPVPLGLIPYLDGVVLVTPA